MKQVMPADETDYGSLVTMRIGTLSHEWLEKLIPEFLSSEWQLVETEYDVTPYLPEGWTGTLDWLFRHLPTKKYVVGDLKSIKPEGVVWLNGKPKKEHVIQVSCYHASLANKNSFDPDIFVCYLPKGKTSKQETIKPVVYTAPAIDRETVFANLNSIKADVDLYVREFKRTGDANNQYLAPMPAPVPKLGWNRATNVWDCVLRQDWTVEYIGKQFGPELCPVEPSVKIGHWTTDGHWIARKGYGFAGEIPQPSEEDYNKRRRY